MRGHPAPQSSVVGLWYEAIRVGAALLLALTTVLAVSPPRPAHAVAPRGNFIRLIPPGGQFKPGVVVEWGFFFTNADGIGQAANPGDEIVVVLPPQVQLI